MSKGDRDIYSDYFAFRNVEPGFYSGFALPAYLKRALPQERDAAILDIGCGFGQMLNALRAEGYRNLAGIDIADAPVEACRAEGHDVSRVAGIAEFCRTAGKRYDFVIMSHVIEHLEKAQIVETLAAVRTQLLKEGGALVVMTPNAQSHTGCYWAYEDFTHTTMFTAGSLYYVLKCAGFQEVAFLDPLGTAGSSAPGRLVKELLMRFYRLRFAFWNFVTDSSFHKPSPQIFTFELRALAK